MSAVGATSFGGRKPVATASMLGNGGSGGSGVSGFGAATASANAPIPQPQQQQTQSTQQKQAEQKVMPATASTLASESGDPNQRVPNPAYLALYGPAIAAQLWTIEQRLYPPHCQYAAVLAAANKLMDSLPKRAAGSTTATSGEDTSCPHALVLRGRAQAGLDEHEEATDDFTAAIDLYGEDASFYFYRGLSYVAQDESADAATDAATDFIAALIRPASTDEPVTVQLRKKPPAAAAAPRMSDDTPNSGGGGGGNTRAAAVAYFSPLLNVMDSATDAYSSLPTNLLPRSVAASPPRIRFSLHTPALVCDAIVHRIRMLIEANERRGGSYKSRRALFQRAMNDLSKAIHLIPTHAYAYVQRSTAALELRRYKESLADKTTAIECGWVVSDSEWYLERARCHIGMARHQPTTNANAAELLAIDEYTRAIALEPEDPTGYVNRGDSYNLVGRFQDAITDASAALLLLAKRGARAFGNLYANDHVQTAMTFYNRGISYEALASRAHYQYQQISQQLPTSTTGSGSGSGSGPGGATSAAGLAAAGAALAAEHKSKLFAAATDYLAAIEGGLELDSDDDSGDENDSGDDHAGVGGASGDVSDSDDLDMKQSGGSGGGGSDVPKSATAAAASAMANVLAIKQANKQANTLSSTATAAAASAVAPPTASAKRVNPLIAAGLGASSIQQLQTKIASFMSTAGAGSTSKGGAADQKMMGQLSVESRTFQNCPLAAPSGCTLD